MGRRPEPRTTPPALTYREGLDGGLSPGLLRGASWDSPTRGLRLVAGTDVGRLDLFAAYTRLNAGTYLSHQSAALAWGMWLPGWMGDTLPLHVTRVRGRGGRARRPDVVGHVAPLRETDVRTVGRLSLTAPAWTWADLAGTRMTLQQLVAAGDSLLQPANGPPRKPDVIGDHPLSSVAELSEVLGRRRSVPGVRKAREALELLRPGVLSGPESRLRLLLLDHGYPEPEVNARLVFPDGWSVVPDLVYREQRIAIEYDGDHHRTDAAQYQHDIARDAGLRARGWTVIKVTRTVFAEQGEREFLAALARSFREAAA